MTKVEVGGRTLSLSNLDKVLYPATGTTKGEVIEYYARIAEVMVPHLVGRGITLRRFPNGVEASGFFEKRCPAHRPAWVRTVPGPGDNKGEIGYCALAEPAALVWAANLAALELHAPMARAADVETPTAVVFDLDPGPPAAMRECAVVALLVREVLDAVGVRAWPKTSGSKGMQLYAPLNGPATHDDAGGFALAVGQLLERQHPALVLTTMAKHGRTGKVFLDWSQNTRHKTTIAPYSLRARPRPTASTPLSWDEVEEASGAAAGGDADAGLAFEWRDVLARVERRGDLFASVLTEVQHLPTTG